MERMYLEHIHMAAYGRFLDKTVGPLTPGLNVVHGKNESGKTTLTSFVGGVLYGWEEARGGRNAYKPASLERCGSLVFRSVETGKPAELSRARNADGLKAEPTWAAQIAEGVEKETFRTFFALNSDELLGLENDQAATSRLMTASAGTQESPAWALERIDARIAALNSRSAAQPDSFANLKRAADVCRERLATARAASDALKEEARELKNLEARIAQQTADLANANVELERIVACQTACRRLDEECSRAQEREAQAVRAQERLTAERRAAYAPYDGVPAFDAAQHRHAQATVVQIEEQRRAIAARATAARDAFEHERARADAATVACAHRAKPVFALLVAAAVLCACGAVALVVFAAVQNVQAAWFMAAFAAVALGAFACAAVLARPRSRAQAAPDAAAAREAMVEAKNLVDARDAELADFDARVAATLAAVGLEGAQGSVAAARALCDAARDAQVTRALFAERRRSAASQRAQARAEFADAQAARESSLTAAGFDADTTMAAVEKRRVAFAARRDALQADLQNANARAGELRRALEAGSASAELDRLKIERAQLATRETESAEELAMLLLARRGLAQALARWKEESQPEVYAKASRLMALMTQGAWPEVLMDGPEGVVVADALGRRRAPRLLSTGTRQQLYLALRIALLQNAAQAGASLPVFADDILVHFDDDRRAGAAAALAELAKTRQVVVFTCHREVVETFARHAGPHTVLAL